jgi:hypothetical protein
MWKSSGSENGENLKQMGAWRVSKRQSDRTGTFRQVPGAICKLLPQLHLSLSVQIWHIIRSVSSQV